MIYWRPRGTFPGWVEHPEGPPYDRQGCKSNREAREDQIDCDCARNNKDPDDKRDDNRLHRISLRSRVSRLNERAQSRAGHQPESPSDKWYALAAPARSRPSRRPGRFGRAERVLRRAQPPFPCQGKSSQSGKASRSYAHRWTERSTDLAPTAPTAWSFRAGRRAEADSCRQELPQWPKTFGASCYTRIADDFDH